MDFMTIYSSIIGAVSGGGVVWFFLQSAKNVKVRKLRRMVDDAGEIAALGDDSVEAAKRKAEEEALTQALKAAVAKW